MDGYARLIMFAFLVFGEPAKPSTLDSIIENVRASELLFEQHDVKLNESFTDFHAVDENENEGKDDNETRSVTSANIRIRSVGQSGKFHVETQGDRQYADGETLEQSKLELFDTSITRVLDNNLHVANIIHGRIRSAAFVRPHMLLLRPMGSIGSLALSTYLSGNEAVEGELKSAWNPNYRLGISYEGAEDFNDLKCHKISIVTVIGGAPHNRWDLWLAESRNYLPVRILGFTFSASKVLPISEGNVSEFHELKPGLWFPARAKVVAFKRELLGSGEQRPGWQSDYLIEEVSLSPQHEPSFFSAMKIPDNTAVYEINDGEVSKSWRQGAPAAANLAESHTWRWWIIGVNVLLLSVGLAVIYVRGRARRRVA